MTTDNKEYYRQKSIEALDKANKSFEELWAALSETKRCWPITVPIDGDEYSEFRDNLSKFANYIDKLQSRLLLEQYRAGKRASS